MAIYSIKDVTLLIKTFNRYECVNRLLDSIRSKYPDIPILIADDSTDFKQIDRPGVTQHRLEVDSGLSFGRNFLIEKTETKYAVLLDDDYVFNEGTDLDYLVNIIQFSTLHMCGGLVLDTNMNGEYRYFGSISIEGTTAYLNHGDFIRNSPEAAIYNIIPNFFICDVEWMRANDIKWDNKIIAIEEHFEFFLSAYKKVNMQVGYTPKVAVIHAPIRRGAYRKRRWDPSLRGKLRQYWIKEKHGLTGFINR